MTCFDNYFQLNVIVQFKIFQFEFIDINFIIKYVNCAADGRKR